MQRSHQLCGQSAFSTLGVQLNQFFPLVSKEKERTTGVSFLLKERAEVSHSKRHKEINKNKDRLTVLVTGKLFYTHISAKVTALPFHPQKKSTTKTKSASCTSGKIMLPAPSVGWDHAAKKPPSASWAFALSHVGLSCQATQEMKRKSEERGETVALTEDFAVCFCFEQKRKKQLIKGHHHSTGYWLVQGWDLLSVYCRKVSGAYVKFR